MAKKILIVDDDHDFVEATASLLEAKGYETASAFNGEEGYGKAKEISPDLILLDVMMANKTEGFDIARKIHDDADTKDIPVIMTTGIRKDMNLSFGFEPDQDWLPVKTVLEKPIKPEDLLEAVEKNI